MALFWRIWTAVTLVNLAVLAIFVGLATLQFDSINSGLVGERLVVLGGRTAAPFQAAARIGLPLSTVRNADALLERARQTDDAIGAIHVFDEAGRIVRSTDPGAAAEIPPEAAAARASAGGEPWHLASAGGFLSGVDIGRADGTSAGGILIVYPASGNVTRVRAMAAELSMAAIAVLLLSGGLSIPLLRFGLRRQIAIFHAVDSAIVAFEVDAWRRAAAAEPGPGPADGDPGGLRQLLDDAEAQYRAAGHALAAARTDAG